MTHKSLSLVMLILSFAAAQATVGSAGWAVKVRIRPTFTAGQSATVNVALPDRLRDLYNIRKKSGDEWEIRPDKGTARPMELSLIVGAAGFKPQTLNRVLNDGRPFDTFTLELSVRFEPDNAPALSQIVTGEIREVPAIEVTVSNPRTIPVTLVTVGFESYAAGGGCFASKEDYKYAFDLTVTGGQIGAQLTAKDDLTRRTTAQVSEHCSTALRFSFPANIIVPPGESNYRFTFTARKAAALAAWQTWAWRAIGAVRLPDGDLNLTSPPACFFDGCPEMDLFPRAWRR